MQEELTLARSVVYASVVFLLLGKINGDQFVWLMGLFIGANSLDLCTGK